MKKYYMRALSYFLIVIAMFLVSCAAEESKDDKHILTVSMRADILNIDPAFIDSPYDEYVSRTVLEGLMRYVDDSGETENYLAEWIKTSEDGLEISFKLREGVMWHKGYGELTAEDVKYSFERYLDPELAAVYADDWAVLDRVDIINKYEGTIVLK